jgi:hypothetical protein
MESLIRSKLEGAEITPSPGAWRRVRRQLRWRQFLRFDPGRFNAYYLGGLLVAGAILGSLMLTDDPAGKLTGTAPGPVENLLEAPAGTGNGSPAGMDAGEEPGTGIQSMDSAALQDAGDQGPLSPAVKQRKITANEEGKEAEGTAKEPGVIQRESEEKPLLQQTLVTYFTPSTESGCAPLTVQFHNASVNATSFSWSLGTGETTSEASPRHQYTEPGRYSVTLTAEGNGGQRSVHCQVIEVYPAPVAGFEITEGLEGPDGIRSLDLMNYSTGAYSYRWDLVGGKAQGSAGWSSSEFQSTLEASSIPPGARSVRLVAINDHGCTDTSLVEIPSVSGGAGKTLQFASAFSPSSIGPTGGSYSPHDKRTDLFHPVFSEVPGEYHLQIFSRMGEPVFETRDIYQGWDGYYQQERTAGGVYLWIVEGTWEDGSPFNLKGDVTLIWDDQRWP